MSLQSPPRQVAPGVHWLPACLFALIETGPIHSYVSTYLITGEERTLLVDAGHPSHRYELLAALQALLGERKLDYVFPTHTELPHAGNLQTIVDRYPDVVVCGDTRDYQLFLPGIADNLAPMAPEESIDLGGTSFTALEAVIRDLPNTLWGHDARSKTLFVGDAMGYSHHHEAGECALLAGELPEPPTVEQIGLLNDAALFWTRYVDLTPYFAAFDSMAARYPTEHIAPAHGAFISNPEEVVPIIKEGMRAGQRASQKRIKAANS